MVIAASSKKNGKQKAEAGATKPKAIIIKYRDRLIFLRQAKEYSEKNDTGRAVQLYLKYLDAIACYNGIKEAQLTPNIFDKQTGLAEILMVSQVYWDLAKSYDRHQKMHKESQRCLDQFVKFSLGFKFQYINSEIIRKYIRKRMAYNHKNFEAANQKIMVNTKGCYVATFCYGEDHQITNELRYFKAHILQYQLGKSFVSLYYRLSPPLVAFLEKNSILGIFFKFFSRPILKSFSFFSTKFIISK